MSSCIVGIANALDLTDRILPRLQARPNCKPQLLNFAPYSKDQIAAILQDRLQMVGSWHHDCTDRDACILGTGILTLQMEKSYFLHFNQIPSSM